MAKKKAKKPAKKSLGMIGGVNERSLSRVTIQIAHVERAISSLNDGLKNSRDKSIKATKRILIKTRKGQLKELTKELRGLTGKKRR